MQECKDHDLISEILAGSTEAFNEIYNRYHRKANQLAYTILRNKADAEDAVQEAFLALHRKLDKFNRTSKFSSWFFRVVSNAALMLRRSQRTLMGQNTVHYDEVKEFTIEDLPEDVSGKVQLYQHEIREVIESAFSELTATQKAVFNLSVVDGFTREQVAKKLNMDHYYNVNRPLDESRKHMRAKVEEYLAVSNWML